MRLLFRPTFWPTLITVPVFLLMVGLSVWQVGRLHWKENAIRERQERLVAAQLDLPVAGSDVSGLEYRRVRLAGEFIHDKELYLAARSLNGAPGYYVVTPFRTDMGDLVLVERGFVSIEKKQPSVRSNGQIAGHAVAQGILRLPRTKSWVQPPNEPEKNVWFYYDLETMALSTDLDRLRRDLYIAADATPNPGGWPIGGQTRVDLPNDHLQYAITWALLALALVVIYVIYHVQRGGKKT